MTGSPSVPLCSFMGVILAALQARGALSFLGGKKPHTHKYIYFKENRCFGKYSRILHASELYPAVLITMIFGVLALKWM